MFSQADLNMTASKCYSAPGAGLAHPAAARAWVEDVPGTFDWRSQKNGHGTSILYGNFDIISLGYWTISHASSSPVSPHTAVQHALLTHPVDRVLTGACNPMLCYGSLLWVVAMGGC